MISLLVGIFKNNDNSFDYLNIINNKLYCNHLDSNGFTKSSTNYIIKTLKELFNTSENTKICEYNEYDVYYDLKSGYKHYIKDGKENLFLFYWFNGKDELLYNEKENSNHYMKNKILKSFKFMGITAIISCELITFLSSNRYATIYNNDSNIKDNENVLIYNYDPICYEQIVKYVNNSNIDNSLKTLFLNENLLNDVLYYYEGTNYEYSANLKFKNISISYFNVDEYNEDESKDIVVVGYYNIVKPNFIFVSNQYQNSNVDSDVEYKRIVSHEYIHLLQAELSKYNYLKEASAELLAKEYFSTPVKSYKKAVKNLMLLIDIIGPEPIKNLLFSGDDSELVCILKNNLSDVEFNTLMNHFQDSDLENENIKKHKEVQQILCTLYKNIYNKDINEDKDILYSLIYDNESFDCTNMNKYFLNTHKMSEYEIISMNYDANKDKLQKNGLLNNRILDVYEQSVDLDEYKNAFDINGIQVEINKNKLDENQDILFDRYGNEIDVYIVDKKKYQILKTLNLKDAYNEKYIFLKKIIKIEDHISQVEWLYKGTNLVNYINIQKNSTTISFCLKGINQRFSNQINKSENKKQKKLIFM